MIIKIPSQKRKRISSRNLCHLMWKLTTSFFPPPSPNQKSLGNFSPLQFWRQRPRCPVNCRFLLRFRPLVPIHRWFTDSRRYRKRTKKRKEDARVSFSEASKSKQILFEIFWASFSNAKERKQPEMYAKKANLYSIWKSKSCTSRRQKKK